MLVYCTHCHETHAGKPAGDAVLGPVLGPTTAYPESRQHKVEGGVCACACTCRKPPEGMIGWDRGMIDRSCPKHGHEALSERTADPRLDVVVQALQDGGEREAWENWQPESVPDKREVHAHGFDAGVRFAARHPHQDVEKATRGICEWLVAMDEPDSSTRRTITLSQIIDAARGALAPSPGDPNVKLAGAPEPQVRHNPGPPDEGGERQ